MCLILECLTTKGEPCKFPFTYYDVKYFECTSVANNGVPWCYTSPRYGNCAESCASQIAGDPLKV